MELDDIQSGVLRPRPTPYAATYIGLRIEDPAAGRELMKRLAGVVTAAASPASPLGDTWVSVALTYNGLQTLGVPRESLDSLPWEFRRGMAANAAGLGDAGDSSPERWEKPLGTGAIHVVLAAVSPDAARLERALEPARKTYRELGPGIAAIWRQDCHALPTEKEPFGFRDGVSHPAIEGSGIAGLNQRAAAQGRRVRARLPGRAGGRSDDPAGGAGPERDVRGASQAAAAGGRVSTVSERQLRRAGTRRRCWRPR